MDFSQEGNNANSVNGNAKAMAKPNIPMAGAIILPVVETCTSKKPIMGPVQENDTSDSVNAIKKILSKPPVFSALESTALLHLEGYFKSAKERSCKYYQHQEEKDIENSIRRQ